MIFQAYFKDKYSVQKLWTQYYGHSERAVTKKLIAAGENIDRYTITRVKTIQSNEEMTTLTYRERQILVYIIEGLTNNEIAGELYLSEKTVKNHVSNILRKYKASNRTVLVSRVLRKKIEELEGQIQEIANN